MSARLFGLDDALDTDAYRLAALYGGAARTLAAGGVL